MHAPYNPPLDADQLRVVHHKSGPARTLAGPGSGKTLTLAGRVAHLLRTGHPRDILCVTFSVAAAKEMRERVMRLMGRRDLPQSMFSTFHSLALRIIYNEKALLPWHPAANMVLEPRGVKQLLRQLGVPKEELGETRREMARMRRMLLNPEDGDEAYQAYDAALQSLGVVDFDSMVYWAVKQIESNPYSAAHWAGLYRHVLVDEAHDVSPDQMRFAALLARDGNLMLFGDESQAIYSFRGADPKVLSEFGHQTYVLGNNYRSGEAILEAFRPLAEPGPLAELMRSTKPGGSVESFRCQSTEFEAETTAGAIKDSGQKPETIAVLARTRALLAPIADCLDAKEIPYNWRGRNFWTSSEIQDVLAWLRVARNHADRQALRRAILSPADITRYLGRKFANTVERLPGSELPGSVPGDWNSGQKMKWVGVREFIRGLGGTSETLPALWVRTVMELFSDPNGDEEPDDFRWENMQQLALRAARYPTIDAFLAHAERAARERFGGVTLSTVHAAKGLEWSTVFVVGFSKDLLPHRRAESEDEERRIAYVALSRAKDRLVISGAGEPSPFLDLIYESKTEATT